MLQLIGSAWVNLGSEALTVQNVGLPGDMIDVIVAAVEPSASERGVTLDQIKETYRITPKDGQLIFARYRRIDTASIGARVGQLYVAVISDDSIKPVRHAEIATSSDVVREYASLSSPRMLTTALNQAEIATIEGDRFSAVKYFNNFQVNTELYVLFENPIDSGVIVGLQKRTFKTDSAGAVFQVLWDYDVALATKTQIVPFNENNVYRATELAKFQVSVLNGVASPSIGEWTINTAANVTSDGIEREIDFINTSGIGSNTSGGISSELGFRIYAPGTGFLAKVTSDANANKVLLGYNWIEAPTSL